LERGDGAGGHIEINEACVVRVETRKGDTVVSVRRVGACGVRVKGNVINDGFVEAHNACDDGFQTNNVPVEDTAWVCGGPLCAVANVANAGRVERHSVQVEDTVASAGRVEGHSMHVGDTVASAERVEGHIVHVEGPQREGNCGQRWPCNVEALLGMWRTAVGVWPNDGQVEFVGGIVENECVYEIVKICFSVGFLKKLCMC
jgi:hypothetical protein